MPRSSKGFTLIELLIVVAIIGIIAALAIPNLVGYIDRARQTATMADMKSIGQAVEAYMVDNNRYPVRPDGPIAGNLEADIEPRYLKNAPDTDGWSNPLHYVSNGTDYTIHSWGKANDDGCTPGTQTQTYDADICYSNGVFTQKPVGAQS
jgi:general secretion pathway protein G